MKARILFRRLRRWFSHSYFEVVLVECTRRRRNERRRIKFDKVQARKHGQPDPHPNYDEAGFPTAAALSAGVVSGGGSVADGGSAGGTCDGGSAAC